MGILTKSRLTAITEIKLGYKAFSEILNEAKKENRLTVTTTVFLSHSHDDLKDGTVNKAIVFLRKSGVSIYIDSHDNSMPPFTNAETANRIKKVIVENKKFILLATERAINSKWCNWELGYGDSKRYIDAIALLPLSEVSGQYIGNEYLRIYPRIEESDYIDGYYKVIYPDGKEISIVEWLKL